jgi:ATP-binding cassette subfamily B protein
LEVPYGKKVGIMGKTGSGKSVLMKLLNRFYDCTGGAILMDGEDIKDMRVDEVRRRYSYVMQDVFLFSESIKKNVSFYDEETPQERIEQVCTLAKADKFIEKLTDGYETIVGEQGLGLSGGQKQRVSIARALLKDAPVILLDDCTSALDYETEKAISENLTENYGERTVITVSHRASLVMNCDEIIYLENGEIVERGTHDELMALKGRYYGVFTEQEALRAQEVA